MGTGGVDKKNDKSILYSPVKKKCLRKFFVFTRFYKMFSLICLIFPFFETKFSPQLSLHVFRIYFLRLYIKKKEIQGKIGPTKKLSKIFVSSFQNLMPFVFRYFLQLIFPLFWKEFSLTVFKQKRIP